MKVVCAARARADLRAIGRWIARDDPVRAVSFVTELREKALALSETAAHRPVIAGADTQQLIRRFNHGDYRIVHQVHAAEQAVTILFIHHGARAYPPLP